MRKFITHITVSNDDLDELQHVNNVRYVQWIQDVAKSHWEQLVSDSILQNYFWVVVSHFIEYKSPALLGDKVRLTTYVVQSSGIKSTRVVEMYNEETDKLLLHSETVWCFMDAKTKRPTKITDEIISLFS